MLYHLFQYLDRSYDLPGAGMFQYISFRSALAVILALLITITFGQGIIRFMQRRQIGEEIRNLGLEGQLQKRGTPTMGGVMILLAVLVPVLLFGRLDNIYIQLMIVSTVWLGLLGFLDDYIKVFRHNKEGLKGKFKIVGQVGIGIIVGTVMCASPEVVVRDKVVEPVQQIFVDDDGEVIESVTTNRVVMGTESVKTTQTTIPFVKNNEFDYAWFTGGNRVATWILYVLVAIFVVTAVSNGANLTDGLDGLVSGVSAPIVVVLAILAYLSGHIVYADYLNIMYIPGSGELVVFAAAFAGALIGFLWYNMKKIWIVSLLLLGCFAARAQAPAPLKGRIAVSVPRVDMRLSYAEYDKAFSGDLRTAQTDLEGRYMLPDDDKIYAVTLHRRDDAAGAPALASFFILPGEQLEVLGLFQDGDTFDWRVKGSPVFEADYEYGRKYRREELRAATLRRQNLAGEWDDLSPERQRQLNAELRLLDRGIKERRCAYIRENPSSPLSAYYFTCQPFPIEEVVEYYSMLSESLREGRYAPILNFVCEMYQRILNA